MHDDISVMRLMGMRECVDDLQIPCRWVKDMGFGYGYPQFNFYGPLPYYVGVIFNFLGFNLMDSVKIVFGLGLILGNLAMFYLGVNLFGNWGGLLSAVAYAYNPYRASDLYSRGAMGETWAFVFMPLILLAINKLVEKMNGSPIKSEMTKAIAFLALSVAGLMVTHNVSVLMFAGVAGVWAVVGLITHFKGSLHSANASVGMTALIKAGVLAVGISAFFFFSVVFESKLVHTETLLMGYFNYLAHFVSLKQLFLTSFWGYGSSEIGATDDLSFFYGPIQMLMMVAAVGLAGRKIIQKYKQCSHLGGVKSSLSLCFTPPRSEVPYKDSPCMVVIYSFGVFIVATFLTHVKSSFIWNVLPFLAYLQFPWRFLVIGNLMMCISAGYLVMNLEVKFQRILTIGLIVLLALFNLGYFRANIWYQITDLEKFSGESWRKQQTVSIFDYLPKSAKMPPAKAAPNLPTTTKQVDFLDFKRGSNWQSFKTLSNEESVVTLNLFDYPNWEVKVDGKKVSYERSIDLGLVTFKLPSGEHKVEVKLTESLVRKTGNLLTVISLIIALWFIK